MDLLDDSIESETIDSDLCLKFARVRLPRVVSKQSGTAGMSLNYQLPQGVLDRSWNRVVEERFNKGTTY